MTSPATLPLIEGTTHSTAKGRMGSTQPNGRRKPRLGVRGWARLLPELLESSLEGVERKKRKVKRRRLTRKVDLLRRHVLGSQVRWWLSNIKAPMV